MRRRRSHHGLGPAKRKSPREWKRKRRSQASPNKLDHSEPKSHPRIASPSSSPTAWLVQRERPGRIAFVVANGNHFYSEHPKERRLQSEHRMEFSLSRMQLAIIAPIGLSEHASDSACWWEVSCIYRSRRGQPSPIFDSVLLHGTGIAAVASRTRDAKGCT
jgi:hypothetical protein